MAAIKSFVDHHSANLFAAKSGTIRSDHRLAFFDLVVHFKSSEKPAISSTARVVVTVSMEQEVRIA